MTKIYQNFCGEDEYQKSRQTDIKPYIHCVMKSKTKLCNIEDKIKNTYEEYFSKKDEKAITYESSVHISNDKNILNEKSFEVYCDGNEYTFRMDHRYFSGLFFMILGKNFFDINPVNVMKEFYIPFVTEFFVLRFLFFMYWFKQECEENLDFVDNKNEIRRESLCFNTDDIKYGKKRKYNVIFHLLSHIKSKLHLKRPLKILIPIAFEATLARYNNVGAIFFYFDGNYENMVNQIEANKYHANATNILQRFVNSGKKARNIVDVVLSCGCFDGGHDKIIDNYVTYDNIADYPIYCLSVTFGNEVKSTITWMNKL